MAFHRESFPGRKTALSSLRHCCSAVLTGCENASSWPLKSSQLRCAYTYIHIIYYIYNIYKHIFAFYNKCMHAHIYIHTHIYFYRLQGKDSQKALSRHQTCWPVILLGFSILQHYEKQASCLSTTQDLVLY